MAAGSRRLRRALHFGGAAGARGPGGIRLDECGGLHNDYASRDMTLRSDAGRYECGTLNTIGCFGLRASIEFLLEVGIERIGPPCRRWAIR